MQIGRRVYQYMYYVTAYIYLYLYLRLYLYLYLVSVYVFTSLEKYTGNWRLNDRSGREEEDKVTINKNKHRRQHLTNNTQYSLPDFLFPF